jgi:fucose 4-O-acetylase-like acetyltransferase
MSATLTRLPPLPDQQAPARPKRRDPWFDNAKMLLVTLVVVGHTWSLLPESFSTTWAYNFLYLWHVPAFVMVTGYLSRSFTFSRRNLSRLLTTVVLPYVVFEAALTTFRSVVGDEHSGPLWLNPHWPMWYLAALFLWRLATPLLTRMPHALPVAVAVSLVGGVSTGDTLDTARAMGLLPFFVMGLLATPEHIDRLRRPGARLAALGAFALALALSTLVETKVGSTEWLYWRSSYAELHVSFLGGVAGRMLLLAAATALALSFFALVPRRGGWFSRLGSATLVVYLFHGFLVKSAEYTAFPDWSARHPLPALVLSTLVAVPVALALAAPPLARRLNVLVDPVGAWQRSQATPRDPGHGAPGAQVGGTELEGTPSTWRASSGQGALPLR